MSDRGSEFNWVEKLGMIHLRTSVYTPELNGKFERRHKESSKLCRILDNSIEYELVKLNTDDIMKKFHEEWIEQVKGLRRGDYDLSH
jgi:hypothetical protein